MSCALLTSAFVKLKPPARSRPPADPEMPYVPPLPPVELPAELPPSSPPEVERWWNRTHWEDNPGRFALLLLFLLIAIPWLLVKLIL